MLLDSKAKTEKKIKDQCGAVKLIVLWFKFDFCALFLILIFILKDKRKTLNGFFKLKIKLMIKKWRYVDYPIMFLHFKKWYFVYWKCNMRLIFLFGITLFENHADYINIAFIFANMKQKHRVSNVDFLYIMAKIFKFNH